MKPPIWLPFGLKPKETPADDGPHYADIYERGLAAAVDATLLFLLFGDLFQFITALMYQKADKDLLVEAQHAANTWEAAHYMWASGLPQLWLVNAMLQVLILGLFLVGCQFSWNTTPGKWLLGLSVRRRADLELPEKWRYILRYVAYIPSSFVFFIVSFNKQRRGLHDLIAGTVVIHTRPKGWYWEQVKRGYRKLRGEKPLDTPVE